VKCQNKSNADKNFIACQKCGEKWKTKNNRPRGVAESLSLFLLFFIKNVATLVL